MDYYSEYDSLHTRVSSFLMDDDIEAALICIFDFIQSNKPYLKTHLPETKAIKVSASLKRLQRAFNGGLIEWELVYEIRSDLIGKCFSILKSLAVTSIEETQYSIADGRVPTNIPSTKYNLARIGKLRRRLTELEELLSPYIKSQ